MGEINQHHDGTGDNIAGDKITIILGKSADYNSLISRIDELREDLAEASSPERRLKKSEQLNEALDQLKQFKDGVIQLAEIFTKVEINTERLGAAKEHFEAGRLREADAILKSEELANDQTVLLTAKDSKHQELQNIDEKLKNNANEYLVKARLRALHYDSNDRIKETCEYFELALKSSRQNKIIFEYAVFLQDNHYFNEAELLYKELVTDYRKLAQTDQQIYEPYIALMQNNLGNLYLAENELGHAEAVYREALEIFKRLASINPQAYYSYVAMTLNNLGNLYFAKNDFEQAETIYKETLEIRRRLAKTDPQIYEPGLAMTQHSLGMLYSYKNNFEHSEVAYKEALEIRKRFASNNPQTYEPYVANTLYNLGFLYQERKDFQCAKTVYKEAIEIYERLAKNMPQLFELKLARLLFNYGLTLVEDNQVTFTHDKILLAKEIPMKYTTIRLAHKMADYANKLLVEMKME
jgi:tetratricopeptide (TPR) repeat protein